MVKLGHLAVRLRYPDSVTIHLPLVIHRSNAVAVHLVDDACVVVCSHRIYRL